MVQIFGGKKKKLSTGLDNKRKKKKERKTCSLRILISLLWLHFVVKNFEYKHLSSVVICIFVPPKTVFDVRIKRAQAGICKHWNLPVAHWESFSTFSNHVLLQVTFKPIYKLCSAWVSAFFNKFFPSYSVKQVDMDLKQSPICSFHALLFSITSNLHQLFISSLTWSVFKVLF